MRTLDARELAEASALSARLDPVSLSLLTLAGFVVLLALYLAQRERIEVLERLSSLDPQTGLMRGACFEATRWPALLRSSAPLAVLYVDLDDLKRINDQHGHTAGDRYIAAAASLLRGAVRRGVDEVVRLHSAGDEFLIVLSCPTAAHALRVAEGALLRLHEGEISASIGVAFTVAAAYRDRAALRERAESAMREAKRQGRGRVILAAPPAASTPEDFDCTPQPVDDYAARPYHAAALSPTSRGASC
ncbi:MAG: GGDEF domain-containing protein [Polyangia bacterium]